MKCKNCGKEITITDLKCPFCKYPVELELGDEFLDDEILSDAITSGISDSLRKEEDDFTNKTDINAGSDSEDENTSKSKSAIKPLLISIILLVLIGVALYLFLHSSFYYLFRASRADQNGDYSAALSFYEKAYCNDNQSLDALIGMGNDYSELGNYEGAISKYKEALAVDPSDRDSYIGLIACYTKLEDEEALDALEASSPESVRDIFLQYKVEKPVFTVDEELYSEATNSYTDDLEVVLSSSGGYDIYFTFDGTDPSPENGTLYTGPLYLTQGTTEIKAVCVNQYGLSSMIAEKQFKVDYAKPEEVVITPESGLFTELTYINIVIPEGSHVYYTWDGTSPNSSSAEYTEPIPVVEGNNIFSVIVINAHGLSSNVFRYNYSYMPDDH